MTRILKKRDGEDCATCRYWKQTSDAHGPLGECHFNPPQWRTVTWKYAYGDGSEVSYESAWPTTEGEDWCSQHKQI